MDIQAGIYNSFLIIFLERIRYAIYYIWLTCMVSVYRERIKLYSLICRLSNNYESIERKIKKADRR